MKAFRCRASESCNQGEVLLLLALLLLMLLVVAPDFVQAKRGFDFEGEEEQSRKLTQISVGFGVDQWVKGCVDCPAGDPNCEGCIKRRRRITTQNALQEEEEEESEDGHAKKRTKKRDIRLAVILGSFSALIALLVCGPLCCICYGAKRIREVRSKAAATHSLMFAEQWRAYNLFMPFNEEEELGQHTLDWSAWQFVFRGIPEELNGLSTAIFQSIPPVSGCLRSYSGQPLQQIRLNPGCARLRRSQSLQCLLPLASSVHPPNCLPNVSYFEMTILSFCRNGKNGRSSGSISGRVAIGLAARPAPPFRLPGLDLVSLGYHSNGSVYTNDPHDGVAVSRRWNYVGVTVGCGYDLDQGLVFFTLNGGQEMRTDFAFRADGPIPSTIPHLFPVVGADCDITAVVNLGQTEFVFPAANARRCEPFGEEQQQQQMFMQGPRMEQQRQQEQPLLLQQQQQQEEEEEQGMQENGGGGEEEGGGESGGCVVADQQQQCCTRGSIDDHESEVYFSASEEPSPPV